MKLHRYTWRTFGRELGMIFAAALFCVPLYVLGALSLKTTPEAFTKPMALPSDPQFSNFSDAWQQGELGGALVTSLVITVTSVVIVLGVGSLGGYMIARRPGRMSGIVYVLFVLGMILPFQLAIIPVYSVLRELNLTGTYAGTIVLWAGLLTPLSVFLYTGFIQALPKEYEEAARVDGASGFRIYARVVLPLLRPVTGTVAILSGIFIWNDFFVSLIFMSGSDHGTLPLALYSFVGESISVWNLIMAAVVITLAPVLAFYLIAQRQLIRGFTSGIRG